MRRGPELPRARGELSAGVLGWLRDAAGELPGDEAVARAEPLGEDLQLALYVLYELHYRGFAGVPDDREWDPAGLGLRVAAEERFLATLRARTGGGDRVDLALAALLTEPAGDDPASLSHFLCRHGELWQLREYAAVRSLYHLKEADPHAWVLPRLSGRAKAAMVAIEFDEFGAGRAERAHAHLFAELMADLALDAGYGRQLDGAPAEALAVVNLMSLFGLRRALRGALVGHFAAVEITSSPGSRRLAEALRRTGAGPAAERFYLEHVEADAVHEQLVRREVVAGLLAAEPELAADVVFGIEATGLVEEALARALLPAWRAGRSALRRPVVGAGGTEGARPVAMGSATEGARPVVEAHRVVG
ncbi:iron-containing redox enzyme family protein [Streptomyces sp. DSM 44915]|uniref:Iron-containing redox enzyme family protein n=1 Tax=Streptomyces chisholmiae TaxID=3075540 RepID=A0ABU2JX65_9ACTN|nr:iron-containing redox enzyme family protein [Streptomyces sp. DSM 44915]MDT0269452.1 iron-containing redox enzyme family protein [Streptomyces sp. DSM 44915]